MTKALLFFLAFAIIDGCHGVSSKMDFGGDSEESSVIANSSNVENEDVEVKHTIVVATKLKNNNRRGIHSSGDFGTLSYDTGRSNSKHSKSDSGEVPIVMGYKGAESTLIRTPDTRYKTPIRTYSDSVFVNRNIRDDFDIFPNIATNTAQWKPSYFNNNNNWWNHEIGRVNNNVGRRFDGSDNQVTFYRKVTNDGMAEFHCRRCRELTNGQVLQGCPPSTQYQNSPWVREVTTQKIKVDGKLAKLN